MQGYQKILKRLRSHTMVLFNLTNGLSWRFLASCLPANSQHLRNDRNGFLCLGISVSHSCAVFPIAVVAVWQTRQNESSVVSIQQKKINEIKIKACPNTNASDYF